MYMVLVNEQERRDYNFGLYIGLGPHAIPIWTCAPCGQHGLALDEGENEGKIKRIAVFYTAYVYCDMQYDNDHSSLTASLRDHNGQPSP